MFKWVKKLFSRANKKSVCNCFPDNIQSYERDGYRRHGAHVLVGTERPLSKIFQYSEESDEDFNKRKILAIEEEGRRHLHNLFYHNGNLTRDGAHVTIKSGRPLPEDYKPEGFSKE
jgi:hypothetical protein